MSNQNTASKKDGTAARKERETFSAKNMRLFILLGGIVLMLAAQCMVSPGILKNVSTMYNYFVKIVLTIESTALIAAGVTFVIICGKNDLSTGTMMQFAASVACVVSASYYGRIGNGPLSVLTILIPVAVCAVIGVFNGILVGVFNLNAFVSTLGTAYVVQAVHVLFNGGRTVYLKNLPAVTFVGKGLFAGKLSFPVLLLAVAFAALGFVLHKTTFGRRVFAVGTNAKASVFSGIDSRKIVIASYLIAGIMSGVAGVFIASYTTSGDMLMGVGKEFDAIIAVVLGGALLTGGAGGMSGTVLGSLFLGILSLFYVQFNININVQYIIRGAVLLLVIVMNSLLDKKGAKKK